MSGANSTSPGISASALDAVGATRLIALDRIHPGPGRIFAKAEFLQPGGSVKDRAARACLVAARAEGKLRPGAPVVEMTSGNMGAGLAVACAVLGHRLIVTMSAGNSPQRAEMLRCLGAEVVLVPQVDGTPGRVTGRDIDAAAVQARAIAQDQGGFYVDQFANPACITAHETQTGPEIVAQLGRVPEAFVACVGSGGTFIGVARHLKRLSPDVLCAAVEPAGARVLAGEAIADPAHLLQGTGYGRVPPNWEAALMDVACAVTDDDAVTWRRKLAVEEGLHVGFSAAANVCASARLLESGRLPPSAWVATILCDTGLKY